MTIKPLHRQMLIELAEAGHGTLDAAGNIRTEPFSRVIAGNAHSWLALVSMGYVAGERGLLMPTEEGRLAVEGLGSGRVREGR